MKFIIFSIFFSLHISAGVSAGLSCLKYYLNLAAVHYQDGESMAAAYEKIFSPKFMKFSREFREYLYIFYKSGKMSPDFILSLESYTEEIVEQFLREFATFPSSKQKNYMVKRLYKARMEQLLFKSLREKDISFVLVDGHPVDRDIYEEFIEIQKYFNEFGVQSEIIPMRSALREYSLSAMLKVIDIEGPKALKEINSTNNIFETEEIKNFIRIINQENGLFAIYRGKEFPELPGFFQNGGRDKEDYSYILALNQLDGSIFAHEWKHKEDLHDNYIQYMDQARILNIAPWNVFRRIGAAFVLHHQTEINATNRELQLMYQSKKFNLNTLVNIVDYQAQNQRKYAYGKLMMNPLNLKGYYHLVSSLSKKVPVLIYRFGTVRFLLIFGGTGAIVYNVLPSNRE